MDSVPLGCCDYMPHNEDTMDVLPNIHLWESESFDSRMAVELHDDDDCYQTPIWPTDPLDFQDDHIVSDEDDLLFSGSVESAMMVLHDRLIVDNNNKITNFLNSNGVDMNQSPNHPYIITTGSSDSTDFLNCIKKEVQSPDHESRKRSFPMPQGTVEAKHMAQNHRRIPSLIPASPMTTTTSSSASTTIASNAVRQSGNDSKFVLPPTPPSSTSSSDTECCREEATASPDSESVSSETESISSRRSIQQQSSSSGRVLSSSKSNNDSFSSGGSIRHPINSPLISYQPKGSTGTLQLTEEEKRTLLSEGYPVPTRLPLTKAEEKSLKKIRRKIKNKISAQESRRKKKEYMDTLERRAQILADENADYQIKLRQLEMDNAELQSQLESLQHQLQQKDDKSQFKSVIMTNYT